MIKKLLMVVAAIAASMGTALAVSVVGPSVAGATTPSPTNYNCAVGGTITFKAPGISAGGALTSATTVTTKASATLTGSGCSATALKVTIPSATTPCPQSGGVPLNTDPSACLAQKNGVYAITTKPNYYNTSASYATGGLGDLIAALQAKPLKTTIDGVAVTLDYGSATQVLPGGACGATAAGFDVTGNAVNGTSVVSTYDFLACLTSDTGPSTTGNFVTDIVSSTAVIATAALGGPSHLTLSLPNMACAVSGAVTFKSPGLSAAGSLTSATSATTKSSTTPTGTNCSGSAIGVTIASATTPCPQSGGVPTGGPAACFTQKNGVYVILTKPNYYDTTASFATSGLTDLQTALQAKPLKTTVGGIPVSLVYGTAAQVLPGGVCGSDVGFHLTGNVLYGSTVAGTYVDNACISGDSGTNTTGNFANDLLSSTATIATATIGGASLLNVTFNP